MMPAARYQMGVRGCFFVLDSSHVAWTVEVGLLSFPTGAWVVEVGLLSFPMGAWVVEVVRLSFPMGAWVVEVVRLSFPTCYRRQDDDV